MRLNKYKAFTLIELLIVVFIISILIALAYPSYSTHIHHAKRADAEVALTNLALALESRYEENNNSYLNITLADLKIQEIIAGGHYQLAIDNTTSDTYQISATPLNAQAKADKECGTLSLSQDGKKAISGTGDVLSCWQ